MGRRTGLGARASGHPSPMSRLVPGVSDETEPLDLRPVRPITVCQKVGFMTRHQT